MVGLFSIIYAENVYTSIAVSFAGLSNFVAWVLMDAGAARIWKQFLCCGSSAANTNTNTPTDPIIQRAAVEIPSTTGDKQSFG